MTAHVRSYSEFLADKVRFDSTFGHHVDLEDIHSILNPHQRDIVHWAVAGGRRAIFASFGLGKTVMQLEILRLTLACEAAAKGYRGASTSGRPNMPGLSALIVCPLGVRQEFMRDAKMLGISVRFIRSTAELLEPNTYADIYLTNYESVREGKVDVSWFTAVSLDEASVLRSFGSKTFQTFLPLFDEVPYRFVATATPSPNRYKELIHYAGFLGVMDTGQALTRFFQRDSTKANHLTLYPHKEREFYLWLNTWATFIQKPSDLGYSDDGYDLPELDVRWHEVDVDHSAAGADRDGQGLLFKGGVLSTVDAAREKRSSMPARIAKACALVTAAPDDHFILWHDLEDERRAIKAAIPEAVEVYGSQDLDEREQRVIDFSDGRFRILATKPSLSGSGCNFQRHCHRAVFVGVGFSFNDFIQSIHRIQRYQQTHTVRIDVIYAESEREVVRTLQRKWSEHKELTATMSSIIREHGLRPAEITEALQRSIGVDRIEASGEGWLAANNDCVMETEAMESDSVNLIVTSIPFANHYEYTPSYNDFGHTDDNQHFWQQMDYLTPQLLRILAPGRIYACHVKDRILFGNVTGAGVPTVSPFHAEAIFHGRKHGFDYLGMITVVTDVVRENNQTYRLGWSEQCKDATKMGVGSPEYVLLFHKPQTDRSKGYADTPVTKSKDYYTRARWQVDAHAFWRSSGDRLLTTDELAALKPDQLSRVFTEHTLREVYDYESHIQIGEALEGRGALPATFMSLAPGSWSPEVWHDINRMLTLNTTQSQRAQQMHVCPLQFDIVDRLITRFSNPGDLVFDPFGGLMTVPVRALKAGRRGRGVELNTGYYLDGVKYLEAEERKRDMPSLFDLDAEAS
ncbi:DNA methylase N-4 [Mycobacterium sp. 852013-50091_SCH5140682]|uniref:DNA methyltransferase n=1 Tax=Mycobacterium sp. 852013-50091_SCH5140682 TaxID=1834109 RepID=UPI0007EBCF5F|nr:DNA methyltransferase [Mycobacterium sp. 852013-50091_SCH5140682]OBC11402.1 DNA methylase N-4 [Mycobacterium sp. 852013-50091_SCH5140682]